MCIYRNEPVYDPSREWDRYCEMEERELARRQVCSECGEPIVEDYCYLINDEYICEDCLERYYKVETPEED